MNSGPGGKSRYGKHSAVHLSYSTQAVLTTPVVILAA